MLIVRISADSGKPDSRERDLDPRTFKDAPSCKSTVRLYLYYCSQASTANWYSKVFGVSQWPRDDGEGTFDGGISTFGLKFPLSRMSNAEDVVTGHILFPHLLNTTSGNVLRFLSDFDLGRHRSLTKCGIGYMRV